MNVIEFLNKHGLNPAQINPEIQSEQMLENMRSALRGDIIDIPMIPTYLKTAGQIPAGSAAVVIDAGGTNYRCALAEYDGSLFRISNLYTAKMPGTDAPVSWDYFISFVADSIFPMLEKTDIIGFCFSYQAKITPDLDCLISDFDKEVIITDCAGKYLGRCLLDELARRGVHRKRCVVLNDTAAALLGNSSARDRERYADAIGMICGTGINTCAAYDGMLINLECGLYAGMPRGDFDEQLDRESLRPGEKRMEKMCSGVYIGKLAKLALNLDGKAGGAWVDMLAHGEDEMQRTVCRAILERSARCMASNILAIMKLTGNKSDKPFCVCAEGSLIEKSAFYRAALQTALNQYAGHCKAELVIGHASTLPGTAVAALLNAPQESPE